MIDPSGKTLLNVPPAEPASGPRDDELLSALRDTVRGSYDLLGVLARSSERGVVYLARDETNGQLVALKLESTPGTDGEYGLTVATELDESIPSPGVTCQRCGSKNAGWVRFCVHCGHDVSGGDSGLSDFSEEQLLEAVCSAAQGTYDVLGQMARTRGGGVVYFARDLASGNIVALRLQRDTSHDTDSFSLDRTQLLAPLVRSVSAEHLSPTPSPAHVPEAAAPPAPGAPAATPAAARGPAIGAFRTELVSAVPRVASSDVADAPSDDSATPTAAIETDRGVLSLTPAARKRWIIAIVIAAVVVTAAVRIATLGSEKTDVDVLISSDTAAPKIPPQPQAPRDTAPLPAVDTAPLRTVDSAVLVFEGFPLGARVLVDGKPVRGSRLPVLPGRHVLSATAQGFEPVQDTLNVRSGRTRWTPRFSPVADTAPTVTPPTTANPPRPERVTCASAAAAQDWIRARPLCREAADGGNTTAQRWLGTMLLQGLGGNADEPAGIHLLQIAADSNDTEAQVELARAFQSRPAFRDDRKAYRLFSLAASSGHVDAAYRVGRANERGLGTRRDMTQAFLWYERAANRGHAGAQTAVGVLLKKGQGVPRDDRKALEWLTKGAAGGNADAHFHIGELHEQGRAGLPRSLEHAREWYRKGAALGSPEAKRAADRLR